MALRPWLDTLVEGADWLLDRWRHERDPESVAFDREHGVDTAGWTLDYEPIRPSVGRAVLDALPVDPREVAFYDLGCGKGRAVLLASERPFRRVVGVEVVDGLAAIARANVEAWDGAHAGCGPVEILHADAAAVPLPPGELVVFLYNPFGAEVVRAVLGPLQRAPGRVWLAYVNPLEADEVREPRWRPVAAGGTGAEAWRIYELVS